MADLWLERHRPSSSRPLYAPAMLAVIDWSVVIATIPVTITAIAGLVAALRAGNQAKLTRIECAVAHKTTNETITAVGDQVVSAANDAATTAAEVKAALDAPPTGG